MDKYQEIRSIPLGTVLVQLGFTGFKKRPGKKEWYGKCPFHNPRKNNTAFSFTDEKFNFFSCGEHGSGAIDLVMKIKEIGFPEAVVRLGKTTEGMGHPPCVESEGWLARETPLQGYNGATRFAQSPLGLNANGQEFPPCLAYSKSLFLVPHPMPLTNMLLASANR